MSRSVTPRDWCTFTFEWMRYNRRRSIRALVLQSELDAPDFDATGYDLLSVLEDVQ